jgi:segregation and condensation protein B
MMAIDRTASTSLSSEYPPSARVGSIESSAQPAQAKLSVKIGNSGKAGPAGGSKRPPSQHPGLSQVQLAAYVASILRNRCLGSRRKFCRVARYGFPCMNQRPSNPAQLLRSVCGRYAGPLLRAASSRGPAGALRLAPIPGHVVSQSPHVLDTNGQFAAHQAAIDPGLRRLEAVLFMSREPLNSRKLSQFANLADGTQARTLVRRLNEHYDAIGRSFRVELVAGGYQLLTRRRFASWLRRLEHVPGETRLSAPALETLAVIAYRQPVPRADIEAIRGVNCGEILRQLMERDLVRIDGRSEELGRPYLYSTTKRFMQVFGLSSLDQLPRADELTGLPLPVSPPIIPFPKTDEPASDEQSRDEQATFLADEPENFATEIDELEITNG